MAIWEEITAAKGMAALHLSRKLTELGSKCHEIYVLQLRYSSWKVEVVGLGGWGAWPDDVASHWLSRDTLVQPVPFPPCMPQATPPQVGRGRHERNGLSE